MGLRLSGDGLRILVAGCGTFEPLVVAQMHPSAREIVAVDLSARSIEVLRARLRWARVARPFSRWPRVRTICGDLGEFSNEPFDYILASNMLHHVPDPAAMLAHLSSLLRVGGVIRVVTYPKMSRHFMRKTAAFLQDIAPRDAAREIRKLSPTNPIRSCFESQPEIHTQTGLIDAFYNACENPLSPLEWENASRAAGLELYAEAQTETSRSSFLTELVPASAALGVWKQLQILDDLLELCANPVLWFRKTGVVQSPHPIPEWRDDLATSLTRAESLLAEAGISLQEVLEKLQVEVGPRVNARGAPLPGLSILDHVGFEPDIRPGFEAGISPIR